MQRADSLSPLLPPSPAVRLFFDNPYIQCRTVGHRTTEGRGFGDSLAVLED